jgi:transcriptional regulator GlxA family with amidase domain
VTRVIVLVADRVELFDVAGPVQAFHEAAAAGADYRVMFVGPNPNARSAQGLSIARLEPLIADAGAGDIVLVPGSRAFRRLALSKRHSLRSTVDWLRAAYESGATIASVCVGAFLLGLTGLLDGRTCTTHWKRVDELQRAFPRARVVANHLYVFDGRVATSAGIASGVDLALAMIERDRHPSLAAAVARELVVSVRRRGSDDQLSPYFAYREHLQHEVHLVQDWLVEEPGKACSLETLAARAGMSTRTLTRRFREATGTTIKSYSTSLRLEQARSLLQNSSLTIDEVAERCGFSDPRQLRRLWKNVYGIPPSAVRKMDYDDARNRSSSAARVRA